jgi:hypothetical protein
MGEKAKEAVAPLSRPCADAQRLRAQVLAIMSFSIVYGLRAFQPYYCEAPPLPAPPGARATPAAPMLALPRKRKPRRARECLTPPRGGQSRDLSAFWAEHGRNGASPYE